MSTTPRWPLTSNVIRRNSLSNTFGYVRKRADGTPRFHQGWDFFATVGTPCYAIQKGEVVFSGERGDLGLIVIHSFEFNGTKYYAAYAHLSKSSVAARDQVSLGQMIGTCGKSGNAHDLPDEDMHLHFEIRTEKFPGLGKAGRVSPIKIYGVCPLKTEILSPLMLPARQIAAGHGALYA